MKLEINDEKIIIYLYRYTLDLDNIENLNTQVKNIFIKLIKIYKMNIYGYFKVHIYSNKNYGNILEIEKKYLDDFMHDIIDLKLVIHENTPFYLEMDDYIFPLKKDKLIIKNKKYYLNLDDIDDIIKYIEYGKIVYKKKI